jgi:uncharacterized protein
MSASKQIYINLIVKDLAKSTTFYEALGFVKDSNYTDQNAVGLKWSDNIMLMLLSTEFATNFTDGKEIADCKKTISAMYCVSVDSKEAVDEFAKRATEAGGRAYENEYNKQYDFMYSLEVEDLDGYVWEPLFYDEVKAKSAV